MYRVHLPIVVIGRLDDPLVVVVVGLTNHGVLNLPSVAGVTVVVKRTLSHGRREVIGRLGVVHDRLRELHARDPRVLFQGQREFSGQRGVKPKDLDWRHVVEFAKMLVDHPHVDCLLAEREPSLLLPLVKLSLVPVCVGILADHPTKGELKVMRHISNLFHERLDSGRHVA